MNTEDSGRKRPSRESNNSEKVPDKGRVAEELRKGEERFRMPGAMADITTIKEAKEAETELRDRGNQLNVLYDLASTVNRADSLHLIYDRSLDAILATLRADRASILLFDEQGVMQFQAWRGLSETYRRAVTGHSPWKRGETGTTPIVVEDVAASDIDPALKTVILEEGIQAMAFVPLTSSGRIIGKFMVYFKRPWKPDEEDLGVTQGIADLLGTGIERKRAEQALRESEQRLRSILDYAPAAIFIKDPAGRYLFMNEQCARVLSVNREQALGNTDQDLLSAELAAQFIANDQRVWESGSLLTVEEQVPQADGVHTSLVQKFLLRDNQGLPYALSGIALDITPHLQLESAIQASEARLQLAQSAANIGVFDWDIAAQKGVWSPELERIWGIPGGGFDGTAEAWRRFVHPDDLTSVHAGSRRSLEDPTTASEFEYRIVRPDGAVRWIYAKAKTLCDGAGRAVRMVGVNLDITDRKEAQLRLERFAEELEAQVEDRTRDLVQSHDRLRAMATELNLVEQRERKRLATELHDHLQQILVLGKLTVGQGKRAATGMPAWEQVLKKVDDIFSDALTYTRTLVSDLSPPVLRDHGLAAALQWLGIYMHKHNLTVTVTVHRDEDLRLPEDQVILLFQSVRELLINSAKHAGTGKAAVRMEQDNGNLRIEVRDEGEGFSLAAAAAPSGGISSKYGLLSIQERMWALGGSFVIESAPGKGTTATLLLPLARNDEVEGKAAGPKNGPPSTLASTLPPPASRIRVLLVDDHIMVRQGLRVILDAYADIELVGEAANGEEALRLVDQRRPTVVVMDINMPKMDGIEATGRIKRRYPETIVVGLSVNVAKENEEAMKRAGAVGLMTKESAVEQLYDAIVEAVKKRA
ncbi:MAG: response regulator [Nitrospira sp.]|nr:response regulator [Nitrospira sp.]